MRKTFRRLFSSCGTKTILVDWDDYPFLSHFPWNCQPKSRQCGALYPRTGNAGHVKLHRLIMNATDGQTVDHINGDTLDCRRQNLRFCTPKENSRNAVKKPGRNKYRGVFYVDGRYLAAIGVDRKRKHLGSFDTEQEAALAYNRAAKLYHGDFARLNEVS